MAGDKGFSDFFYAAPDGLKLHARIYGETNAQLWPVVCLPGLTRNARDFHELALHLSRNGRTPRKVIAFDYRGRGSRTTTLMSATTMSAPKPETSWLGWQCSPSTRRLLSARHAAA